MQFRGKSPRKNGLTRGYKSPLLPPHSFATGRTPGRSNRRAFDKPQFLVNRSHLAIGRPQSPEDLVKRPVGVPCIEEMPRRLPRSPFLRRNTLSIASPQYPDNTIYHAMDDRPFWRTEHTQDITIGRPMTDAAPSLASYWIHQRAFFAARSSYQFSDKA